MSADLDDVSREELEAIASQQRDEIAALESELQELKNLMEAYNRQLQTIKTVLLGENPDGLGSLDGFGDSNNLVDRMEMLEAQLDGFAERLNRVPEKPEEQTDTNGRLVKIQQYLVEQAHKENVNTYGADYREIRALFGGGISDSWASQLMRKAAGMFPDDVDEAKHGFEVVEKKPRNEIRVYCDQVEDRSLLRLKNSERGE